VMVLDFGETQSFPLHFDAVFCSQIAFEDWWSCQIMVLMHVYKKCAEFWIVQLTATPGP
jgi:hypothetical protein